MSGADRKESEVRRMMEGPPPAVPADLGVRAAAHGGRLLRRRRALRRAAWLLIVAAALAFAVWATVNQPWLVPPSETTPPLEGF
jgi:ferric-dicitrate binding protein FerR (iron transport regulator)